jgi:predicted choloylglycine hydrolase
MAYNITMIDKNSDHRTINVGPNQIPLIIKDRAATNRQQVVEWENYTLMTSPQVRIDTLKAYINVPYQGEVNLLNAFAVPSLYVCKPESLFVALYRDIYRPRSTSMKLLGNEIN